MKKWFPALVMFSCWFAGPIYDSKLVWNLIAIVMQTMFVIYWCLYVDKTNV